MSVRLLLPCGTTLSGPEPSDVLLAWGALQWEPVDDLAAVKVALSRRVSAAHRGRVRVDPTLPAGQFLTAIEAAGLCAVMWEGSKAKPAHRPMDGDR